MHSAQQTSREGGQLPSTNEMPYSTTRELLSARRVGHRPAAAAPPATQGILMSSLQFKCSRAACYFYSQQYPLYGLIRGSTCTSATQTLQNVPMSQIIIYTAHRELQLFFIGQILIVTRNSFKYIRKKKLKCFPFHHTSHSHARS